MPTDQMELREDELRKHYDAAAAMLEGFDHAPRIAKAVTTAAPVRSPGIGTRRRFRPTTPGLVTHSMARPEGVRLLERIEAADGEDPLVSPTQASVMRALRRGLAIALAIGDAFGEATGGTEAREPRRAAAGGAGHGVFAIARGRGAGDPV